MRYQRSSRLFNEAKEVIPGGVNSPVRAFKAVGGNPVFIKKAKGAYLFDEDNNKYEVRVVFSFVNDTDPIEIDFLLERVK